MIFTHTPMLKKILIGVVMRREKMCGDRFDKGLGRPEAAAKAESAK